ncbi:unnamed protein product [Allacma fusca]|uniref:Uncharacterized protein n=1 Tax=Allacma fusca TaxID=39272 RepID=A0A8J2PTB6_9HEXA|nr:unnamed protein product [Allacma fusca]
MKQRQSLGEANSTLRLYTPFSHIFTRRILNVFFAPHCDHRVCATTIKEPAAGFFLFCGRYNRQGLSEGRNESCPSAYRQRSRTKNKLVYSECSKEVRSVQVSEEDVAVLSTTKVHPEESKKTRPPI